MWETEMMLSGGQGMSQYMMCMLLVLKVCRRLTNSCEWIIRWTQAISLCVVSSFSLCIRVGKTGFIEWKCFEDYILKRPEKKWWPIPDDWTKSQGSYCWFVCVTCSHRKCGFADIMPKNWVYSGPSGKWIVCLNEGDWCAEAKNLWRSAESSLQWQWDCALAFSEV